MLFRKKPVVIEAWPTADLIVPAGCRVRLSPTGSCQQVYDYLHETWVNFNMGDYIIKGVQGEFYPCKADIFAATYEPVEESAAVGAVAGDSQINSG